MELKFIICKTTQTRIAAAFSHFMIVRFQVSLQTKRANARIGHNLQRQLNVFICLNIINFALPAQGVFSWLSHLPGMLTGSDGE